MCHQSLFGPGFVLVSGLVPDGLDFIVLLAGNAKVVVLLIIKVWGKCLAQSRRAW